MSNKSNPFNNKSTIYGPVNSWRFGQSLGVDPIFETSTCSFNCVYCQLGQIQKITQQRKIYVKTEVLVNDFEEFLATGKSFDVLTYSGSGEPTLALNLAEIIQEFRKLAPHAKQFILSNATELHVPEVRLALAQLDKVIVKIDAWDEQTFQMVNRPAAGITLENILRGIESFAQEHKGDWEVQTMLMPMNNKQLDQFLTILKQIKPKGVQLNTPKRPYPSSWHRENRGNHLGLFDYPVHNLKTIDQIAAAQVEEMMRQQLECPVYSVYR
jgi:wyosine [tRNA(Phe)-imidazoG37] synthetase (radical SAM superfamily)